MDLSIREMRAADRDTVIDLQWQLNRHEASLTDTRSDLRDDAAACLVWHEERIRGEEWGAHLVGEVDGRVIAYMCVSIQMAPPFVKAELRRHLCVSELVVDLHHRSKGLGGLMLAEAERLARAKDVGSILIGLVAENAGADALYARSGFALYAIERLKRLSR